MGIPPETGNPMVDMLYWTACTEWRPNKSTRCFWYPQNRSSTRNLRYFNCGLGKSGNRALKMICQYLLKVFTTFVMISRTILTLTCADQAIIYPLVALSWRTKTCVATMSIPTPSTSRAYMGIQRALINI